MQRFPSRTEKRLALLYAAAETGHFSLTDRLYPSEIKKLRKNGFAVSAAPSTICPQLWDVIISWNNAYPDGSMPHLIYAYIHNVIQTWPRDYVYNLAQELCVIAYRTNYTRS